jgi:hypothetical protein
LLCLQIATEYSLHTLHQRGRLRVIEQVSRAFPQSVVETERLFGSELPKGTRFLQLDSALCRLHSLPPCTEQLAIPLLNKRLQ